MHLFFRKEGIGTLQVFALCLLIFCKIYSLALEVYSFQDLQHCSLIIVPLNFFKYLGIEVAKCNCIQSSKVLRTKAFNWQTQNDKTGNVLMGYCNHTGKECLSNF